MISYHWKYQKEMREVKTELESKGLRVWMDVDKMKGDTIETMARAVEKSSVILIAMSREYQNSTNCRSGSFISIAEVEQRRQQRLSTNQLITSRFSCDFTAAICWCTKQWRKMAFSEFDSNIMQNLSNILPLFCAPTWPSHHLSKNQEYRFRRKPLYTL